MNISGARKENGTEKILTTARLQELKAITASFAAQSTKEVRLPCQVRNIPGVQRRSMMKKMIWIFMTVQRVEPRVIIAKNAVRLIKIPQNRSCREVHILTDRGK